MKEYPKVGTGVWIRKNNKVLLGFRTWKHAPNTWSPPGGKLEMYEDPEKCAERETHEETGLAVKNIHFAGITNDVYEEVKQHYITLHYVADWESGEAACVEPEKFERWEWFSWDALPEPLLKSAKNFVKTNINPFTI